MKISREKPIEHTLRNTGMNGGRFWSREDGDIHAPSGTSTIDTVNVLGQLGADVIKYPVLADVFDFLLGYQRQDGAFRYSPKSSALPCMTARVLTGMGRIGLAGEQQLHKSFLWLLDQQHLDGGWRCSTIRQGASPETDASNPGTTLYALDALSYLPMTTSLERSARHALTFLEAHWGSRSPLGPCGFGIGSRFLKPEFPFLRYNIFYLVVVLSKYERLCSPAYLADVLSEFDSHLTNGEVIYSGGPKAWRALLGQSSGEVCAFATEFWRSQTWEQLSE